MAQNMYRVGDYVFFEISNSAPYQIRKIEELNKTATGNVEARVVCFYRRRDIPPALLKIADQSERRFDEYYETDKQPSTFQPEQGHAVANGAKTEEEGPSGEQSNGNANHDGADNASSSEGTVEPKKIKEEPDESSSGDWGVGGLPLGADQLSTEKRHMLRQKELFLSRQVETLPATHIRGKCMVTLLSEVETPESYDREDAFFYSLVYDPQQQTLLADKGAIRVGEKHQAVVSEWDDETGQELPVPDKKPKKEVEDNGDEKMDDDDADNKENGGLCIDDDDVVEEKVGEEKKGALGGTEMLVYQPTHSLSDRDIDQFLIIARAVGTFSRALDTSSSMKLPSLHMTAAAASRDVTLLHAMAILHQANYDMGQAVKFLVPPPSKQHYPLDADKTTGNNTVSLGGPILCRDQMEEWSASEANLFEEAIEKYGKDFNDVHHDFLPWKSMRDIVEYYYMWKTTNRYVDQKKAKNAEQESKLKQVYIPNYNKPNPNLVAAPTGTPIKSVVPCESCQCAESSSWYVWGPAQAEMRLCGDCWIGWKKGGGLRRKHEFEKYDIEGADGKNNTTVTMMIQKNALPRVAGGALVGGRCGQVVARLPADHPAHAAAGLAAAIAGAANSKARVSFHLQATLPTRIARRLAPKSLLNLRKSARRPALAINQPAIKTHCMSLDAAEVLKCAKTVCGSRPIQPQFLSALASGTLWQQAGSSGTPKRPLSANGMEPPAKKPAFA